MRALCGAIITAGALIGLGLASIGIGTRYQNFSGRDIEGNVAEFVRFRQLDTALMLTEVALLATLLVGLGIAFIGLALHHERRHRERLRELGHHEHGTRVTAGTPTT